MCCVHCEYIRIFKIYVYVCVVVYAVMIMARHHHQPVTHYFSKMNIERRHDVLVRQLRKKNLCTTGKKWKNAVVRED